MSENVHATREAWLIAASLGLKPLFLRVGHPLITPVRLSVGFPSQGGLSVARRRVGECWGSEASASGVSEIFVSPLLDDALDVLGTVGHELGHVILGAKVGHKKPFAVLMEKIGLEGKATATVPGPRFKSESARLIDELGPFPHGRLVPIPKDQKEKVAIFRCSCPVCGYVCRVIRRWLEVGGPPICPIDKIPLVEG